MDTLQANFPQVVPLSLPEVREQHEQHRRQLTKSIYSTRNDRGRYWSNYAMVGGESVVRSKFASKCEVKFLRLILRELDRLATLVLLGYHSESLDIVRLGLEHVDEEIERLTAHNLFPTARIHQSFLKEVESRVRVMARYVDLWDEMESTWEHVEETGTQGSAIVPVDTTHWPDSLQWPVWCRNNAPHLSEQDLKDLEAPDDQVPVRLQDVDRDQILARVQYLPRGGRSILEHWRQDVTDMLAPILQLNDVQETQEQKADLHESYFKIVKDDRGKFRQMMHAFESTINPDYRLHMPKMLARPRICIAATLLEKRLGVTQRMQGDRWFGVVLRTFYNIAGMRAASERRILQIRGSGRNW